MKMETFELRFAQGMEADTPHWVGLKDTPLTPLAKAQNGTQRGINRVSRARDGSGKPAPEIKALS